MASLRRSSRNKKRSVTDLQETEDQSLEKKSKHDQEADGYAWLKEHDFTFDKLKPFGLIIHSVSKNRVITEIEPKILFKLCWKNSFIVFRGFQPLEDAEFIKAAESLGSILKWEFGEIMNVKQVPNPKTTVTSHFHVPFHFDGMFFKKIPSYQLFQCVEAPDPETDPGGETTCCNTVSVIKEAPKEKLELWKKAKFGYYTSKNTYFGGFKAIFDLIDKHPHTGEPIIRYHEPSNHELQPVITTYEGAKPEDGGLTPDQIEEIHKDMTQTIYDPKYCYKQQWHAGDFLLTDNHGQLHGRTAFKHDSPRHLKRIHIGPHLDVKGYVELKSSNQNDEPDKQ